jgi:hypothetical protein
LLFNVETLQAFGALFQIPHYYRKFLHCKSKMLCIYINTIFFKKKTNLINIIINNNGPVVAIGSIVCVFLGKKKPSEPVEN